MNRPLKIKQENTKSSFYARSVGRHLMARKWFADLPMHDNHAIPLAADFNKS